MKLPFEMNLHGKTAVVTGAGGVICSVLSEALARTGAKVAMLNRSAPVIEESAARLTAEGLQACAYVCDVLDKARCEAVREQIRADFGLCDILINGAGGNRPAATTADEYFAGGGAGQSFFDLPPEAVSEVFSLNFMGVLIPSQVFAVDMVGRPGTTIINISSMNAYTPLTKIPAYSGAKAAVSNFTQWMAVYFSKAGVRCNAIAPGFFATKQNRELLFDPQGRPTPRTEKILAGTPMGRFGEIEELIGATLFLASSEASGFVNGAILPIDGGFSAYSGV